MSDTILKDNFEKKLKSGGDTELEFLGYLLSLSPDSRKIDGNFKDYDFISSGKTYELKDDEMSEKTGNFAFEFLFKDKWSGIASTKADYWVQATKISFYIFESLRLRDFLKTNWEYLKKVKGGDENLSNLVLIDKDSVLDNVKHKEIVRKVLNI